MKTLELSQRNLLTLLYKLQVPGSLATLDKPTSGGRVLVTAVADEVAYADRQPGLMSLDTEQFIAEMEELLAIRRAKLECKQGRKKVFAQMYGCKV